MFNFFRSLQGYRRFSKLPLEQKQFVFYAESDACWVHYRPVVKALARRGIDLCYLCSSPTDPLLKQPPTTCDPSLWEKVSLAFCSSRLYKLTFL